MSSYYGSGFDALVAILLRKLGVPRESVRIRTVRSLPHWGTCHIAGNGKMVLTLPRLPGGSMSKEARNTMVTDILLHEIAHAICLRDGKGYSHSRGWGSAYAKVYACWEQLLEEGNLPF